MLVAAEKQNDEIAKNLADILKKPSMILSYVNLLPAQSKIVLMK